MAQETGAGEVIVTLRARGRGARRPDRPARRRRLSRLPPRARGCTGHDEAMVEAVGARAAVPRASASACSCMADRGTNTRRRRVWAGSGRRRAHRAGGSGAQGAAHGLERSGHRPPASGARRDRLGRSRLFRAFLSHAAVRRPGRPSRALRLRRADITAIVGRGTMVGTQFHPEKSQAVGLRLIANFLRMAAVRPRRPRLVGRQGQRLRADMSCGRRRTDGGGGPSDHGRRDNRPRRGPRPAPDLLEAQAAPRAAARHRAPAPTLPQRRLRGALGRGSRGRSARQRSHPPRDLRRPLPRRHPRVSRGADWQSARDGGRSFRSGTDDTGDTLARAMIGAGLEARLVAVDPARARPLLRRTPVL
jgi:hypothetical protein